ncbi:outer membrane protein assembly factor BamE [[Haemophilus] ducreyi]|uniref:outer membrane protein assembly factor BamE n=1 Tax=Haemophilus ducreyi TaxID=730 RepID=UPI000654F660|nr:outer membrane protein assembly factor BamE [[Haemophilus] ducreyi]AKO45478.1 membrane biogenesis protein [[Haemophilus] ducreyi]AKO46865.1 membrane biogenesis protein [[Haemophilus] ducreyi]AKO48205.1 membrane biogenesis protein [[Haemophilus] ducreyi]AKO49596.1 membrane biogenesis protein [[Haemophilus] ducreyi]ANF62508.1 membrane biogenesis protein [[Haemophilus] ducreyi]
MKIKSLLAIALLAVGVTGCSTIKKVVYRIDVPQGNYLEQDKIDQVKIGMNKTQVQYLLGTPMLKDIFHLERWNYIFIKREGYNDPVQHTLFIYFDKNGLVKDIQLDKPILEAESQQDMPKQTENMPK